MGGGDWAVTSCPEETSGDGLKVNVRCTDGSKFAVEAAAGSTVGELKESIASRCGVPVGQQRLIYKGRILGDDQTIENCGVESDHTIHLVRGAAPSASSGTPMTTQAPASQVGTQGQGGINNSAAAGSGGFGDAGLGGLLFPELGASGRGSFGTGFPDLGQMQHHLNQNPNIMRDIMNMPLVQNIMNNPEVLRNLITNNPQMREVLDRNPDLAHVINDPNILRQTLEAARNPELMREMMRNTDRAMSNIESSPEGFNMLRRMYETVQEPFLNATMPSESQTGLGANPLDSMFGSQGGTNAQNRASNPSGTSSETTGPSPNSSPLPNPWGNTNAGNGQGNNIRSSPSPPADTRAPGIAGIGLQGLSDLEQIFGGSSPLSQLLQNPALSQTMQNLFLNPQVLNESSNQIRELLQNSEFLQHLTSPEALQLLQPLQQWVSSLARPPATQEIDQNGNSGSGTPNIGLDFFMNMLGGAQGAGGVGQRPNVPPEELYAAQLSQLREMGFFDTQENIRALSATSGNVHAAVDRLLGNPGS